MQEKALPHILGAALLLDVVQRTPVEIHIELRARGRLAGHDRFVLGHEFGPLDDMRCHPSCAAVLGLTGANTGNVVLGEVDAGQTLVVEQQPVVVEGKVEVVESVQPALIGKVVAGHGEDVQEETRRKVRGIAWFLEVIQRAVDEIHIEFPARQRLGRHDRSIRGPIPIHQPSRVVEEEVLVLRREQGVYVNTLLRKDEPTIRGRRISISNDAVM